MSDIGRMMLEASTGMHGEVAQTIANEWARVAGELKKMSVANIMLEVVPGDGSGLEVYAKSVAEVEQKLSDMGGELEDWQLGIKRHPEQLPEAVANLVEATEGLMTWQVKNVKVWNNSAYDTAHMRLKQLRAINVKGPTPT